MPPLTQTPDFLYEAQLGFYSYCTLRAAINLNIFDMLLHPSSGDEIAAQSGKSPAPVLKLLEALAAMGLTRRDGDLFHNTPLAELYCLPDSQYYQGTLFTFTHDSFGAPFYDQSMSLTVLQDESEPVFDEVALGVAAGVGFALPGTIQQTMDLIRDLDCFERANSFLDLGGGPGLFAMAAADMKPDLDVTVFDLPSVIPHARKTAEHFGNLDRLHFVEGDMFLDNLGGPHDIIFLSDCMSYARKELPNFFRHLKKFMTPRGALVLRHNETTHDENTPKANALLNLGATLIGFGDYMFTKGAIPKALQEAGFSRIQSSSQMHMTHHYMIHMAQND